MCVCGKQPTRTIIDNLEVRFDALLQCTGEANDKMYTQAVFVGLVAVNI